MIIEYIHPELGRDVDGRAGYYTPIEEHTIPYGDREVLYVLGCACLEKPCCSAAGAWAYIQVPGFLVRKHIGGSTLPISEIEIIENEDDRNRIRQMLMNKHLGAQVEIWGPQYAQKDSPRSSAELAEQLP